MKSRFAPFLSIGYFLGITRTTALALEEGGLLLLVHAGIWGEDARHHWRIVVEHIVILEGMRFQIAVDFVLALLLNQVLMEFLKLRWVLGLDLDLLVLNLDVTGTGVGRAPKSAIVGAVLGFAVVLAEVAAGRDAAAGREEGRGVVAELGRARSVGVLAADERFWGLEVDPVLALPSKPLARLVILTVAAVELLHVLDDLLAGHQLLAVHLVGHLHLQPEEAVLDVCITRKLPLQSSTNYSSSLLLLLNLDSVISIILDSMQFFIARKPYPPRWSSITLFNFLTALRSLE
jgi:hypothetical protein